MLAFLYLASWCSLPAMMLLLYYVICICSLLFVFGISICYWLICNLEDKTQNSTNTKHKAWDCQRALVCFEMHSSLGYGNITSLHGGQIQRGCYTQNHPTPTELLKKTKKERGAFLIVIVAAGFCLLLFVCCVRGPSWLYIRCCSCGYYGGLVYSKLNALSVGSSRLQPRHVVSFFGFWLPG
jgi:hypothetical protein